MRCILKLMLLVLVSLFMGCAETTTNVQSEGPTTQEALMYQGPKARIAVASFRCKAAKCSGEIGNGLSDMLATALFRSNRFVVLERGIGFEQVKKELELGQSEYVSQGKAVQKGHVESADVLVVGAITAFEPNYKGGGGLVGGLFGTVLGGAGGKLRNAYISADIRLVDVRTGRIINATTVEGDAVSYAVGGLGGSRLSSHVYLGGALGIYKNTPMEKAIRVMLDNAVAAVANMVPQSYYRYGENIAPATPVAAPQAQYMSFPQVKTLYVTGPRVDVRSGPGTNYPVISSLETGAQLRAIGRQGGWYQVTLPNGEVGWIYQTLVREQ